MKRVLYITICMVLARVVYSANAEDNAKAEVLLKKAESVYQLEKYSQAQDELRHLLKSFGSTLQAQKAAALLTDIYIRSKEYTKAARVVERFRRYYPGSRELPRMAYLNSILLMRGSKNTEAAEELVLVLNKSDSKSLHSQAQRALYHLVENGGLAPLALQDASDALENNEETQARLIELLGDLYLRQGQIYAARAVYESWMEEFSHRSEASRVEQSLKRASKERAAYVSVALMAPLSGELEEIGQTLIRGVILALEEYNLRKGIRIEYHLIDTEGRPLLAVQRLRRLMRQERLAAIIGPAMSDVATAVAIELSSKNSSVAMVTPTATTQGIADLGKGIFQLNVSPAVLAKSIAHYAVHCLNLQQHAILAPRNEYGYELAEAYKKTVLEEGATVLGLEYYNPDDEDFGSLFKVLRQRKAEQDLERIRIDKDLGAETELNGRTLTKMVQDSILNIDGIFIAANNADEAYKLASQTHYQKLKGQILGASGWHDRKILRLNSSSLQGAIFSVDFPEGERDSLWNSFQSNFEKRWRKAPDRVAGLGYNSGRFVTEAINSVSDELSLIPVLQGIRSFSGLKGQVVIDSKSGANVNTSLFKVGKKSFEPLQACPEQ